MDHRAHFSKDEIHLVYKLRDVTPTSLITEDVLIGFGLI
jgi:tRNA A37 methylthiotransferase MiaB